MSMVEPSFERSTFSNNRQRLLRRRVSQCFFDLLEHHETATMRRAWKNLKRAADDVAAR